jgi:hypothetical protein
MLLLRYDKDHQRKDDRACRDKLAAQDAGVHRDAAGERECKSRQQRDAPVAHDAANKGRKNENAAGRDRPGQNPSGANGAGHGGIEGCGIGCRWNRRKRIGVEQPESVQQPKPQLQ